jgi:hypothetical protein
MSELKFSPDEIDAGIAEIPSLYRSYVERAFAQTEPSAIEEIAFAMIGERPNPGMALGLGPPINRSSLWACVLDEVHTFLCTSSPKYKDERTKSQLTFQGLITVISSAVSSMVNVGVGILSGLTAIALSLVVKMGKNAWCQMYEARKASAEKK